MLLNSRPFLFLYGTCRFFVLRVSLCHCFLKILLIKVALTGVEPARLSALDSKSSVSTFHHKAKYGAMLRVCQEALESSSTVLQTVAQDITCKSSTIKKLIISRVYKMRAVITPRTLKNFRIFDFIHFSIFSFYDSILYYYKSPTQYHV